jgi:hypothetical protein
MSSFSRQWRPDHSFFVIRPLGILSSKINPKINYLENFAKRPLGFIVIRPQFPNSQEDPWFLKIFPNIHLATFPKLQIGPQNSFHHIFATTTPTLAILAPKFSESLPLLFYALI